MSFLNIKHKHSPPLIAHIVHCFETGGMQNGLVNIINRLPRDKYQHAIIALTHSSDFSARLEPQVSIRELHKQPGKDLGLYVRMFRTLKALKPDLVHTRNLATLEMQLPALLNGVRSRVHSLHGWDVGDLDGSNKNNQRLNRFFQPLVQSYVPLSQDLAGYLRGLIGVPASKITSICNGVDTDRFSPQQTRAAVLQNEACPPSFDQHSLIVGTVGRLEQVKDQVTLARSFAILLQQRPELRQRLRLLIVGEGSQREAVTDILRAGDCLELSWLAGEQHNVVDWLNMMDLFVLPSQAEGISNTILEALACGLPVIATAVGGNTELVIDGQVGALVPAVNPDAMAAAIADYIEQPDLLAQQSQAARQLALERFSLAAMVAQYDRLYSSLLDGVK